MARNEEKQLGRLNRLWLQHLDEENAQKNPKRPGLGSLKTAAEVKKWIPSIKNDIDFYLKQSQVACYPERKITEFSDKIESLTKEYKTYIRKYRQLEPTQDSVPWTESPYTRKRKIHDLGAGTTEVNTDQGSNGRVSITDFLPIYTPVLEDDVNYTECYGYQDDTPPTISNINTDMESRPLNFCWNNAKTKPTDESSNESNTKDGLCCLCRSANATNVQDGDGSMCGKFSTIPTHIPGHNCTCMKITNTDINTKIKQTMGNGIEQDVIAKQRRLCNSDEQCASYDDNRERTSYHCVEEGVALDSKCSWGEIVNIDKLVKGTFSNPLHSIHDHNVLNLPYSDSSSSDES